ncbi:MAG: tetratricopeptide repeat protein [Treponema sp.]|jgi:cytochrome c-type biogenesis protein CcmH/NrfG|nr:tetratricopeptide repeat protein [Treponema sp.]
MTQHTTKPNSGAKKKPANRKIQGKPPGKLPRIPAISIFIFTLVVFSIAAYTIYTRHGRRTEFAQQIVAHGAGRWARPDAVTELRRSIAANERRIERHVAAAARNANYWMFLGIRLQQQGLHSDALQAFAHAIDLAPEDPILHFHTGVSAAITAKSFHVFPGRDMTDRIMHFQLAEDAFLRAIELDERYIRPRFSLGELYVFDLNRPEEAIVHLQRVLDVSPGDLDAMFVLARAFYMIDEFHSSIAMFDRIIAQTRDPQTRQDAQNNREIVMRRMHGWW